MIGIREGGGGTEEEKKEKEKICARSACVDADF